MKPSRPLAFLATLLLAAAAPHRLGAQVGYDPSHSPYHDILRGNGWTVMVGHVYGSGGPLRVSPNSGTSVGVRYDVRFSRLLQGFAGLSRLGLQREILNHDDSLVHRYTGPVDQQVWTPEIGMQLNVTGAKNWRGIAPFAAVGLGAAVGNGVAADTNGLSFGTKLLFTPSAGVRFYVAERLHVRVEGQLLYWKMKYPSGWTLAPKRETTAPPPVANVTALNDWVHTPGLRVGIGYAF